MIAQQSENKLVDGRSVRKYTSESEAIKRFPIPDPLTVYPGGYIRASINFYPFKVNGNRGVVTGLGNAQFWCEGELLTNRMKAEAEFDALDVDDNEDFLNLEASPGTPPGEP